MNETNKVGIEKAEFKADTKGVKAKAEGISSGGVVGIIAIVAIVALICATVMVVVWIMKLK